MKCAARLSAILLLIVWIGPVTFAQTDAWQLLRWVGAPERAAAEPRVIPAGRALVIEPGTRLRLHLRDSSVVEGRLLGRTLLDSALYAQRFTARARSSAHVPLTLGETLHVVLLDGHERLGRFAGYAELTLLLQGSGESRPARVPFEFTREIRRTNNEFVDPNVLAREFRAGSLPSAEALALLDGPLVGGSDPWALAHRVAVEDIEWASGEFPTEPSSRRDNTGGAAEAVGIILVSVVVSVVVVFWIIGHSIRSGCRYSGGHVAHLPLTTRPFDRDRGCYVGEPLAAADPWPGATVESQTAASADPGASPALAAR